MKRYAIITDIQRSPLATVERYLPSNYSASLHGESILIEGTDSHGWTMDGYICPRLASGLHWAREISEAEATGIKAGSP